VLTFHDRLYGRLDLPDIATTLATRCPLLLRLREVRMSNIPFLAHPSFANVDRYEHSLGVAHLAWRWARRNDIGAEAATALTLAALYHDAATPAYGHLFEGFLKRWGFDHEQQLNDVLIGRILGRSGAQVFLGGICQLPVELRKHPNYGTDLNEYVVADIAGGGGALGQLVSGDIDFDNIDNVIRATTAMGIGGDHPVHPYDVIDSIVLEDGVLRLSRERIMPIAKWMQTRYALYDAILTNEYEFRAQCAFKWAIATWFAQTINDPVELWMVTDPVLTFRHLYDVPFARILIDRLRVGRPPRLLFSAILPQQDDGVSTAEACERAASELSALTQAHVYVDYYQDKRRRPTRMEIGNSRGLFSDEDGIHVFGTMNAASTARVTVIGAVIVSQAEAAHCYPSADIKAEHNLSDDDVLSVIVNSFGASANTVSRHWLGAEVEIGNPYQQTLFGNGNKLEQICETQTRARAAGRAVVDRLGLS
jgi:hypothetical protein